MRSLLVAALAAVCLVANASAADAKVAGTAATSVDGVSATASNTSTPEGRRAVASTTPQPVCTYQVIPNSPQSVLATPGGPSPLYDSTHSSTNGSWLFKQCIDAAGNETLTTVWIPTANPAALAQQAISDQSLPVPQISTSPPLSAGAVVNFPTWLWVNPVDWHTVTATAAVNGFSVTATAAPVSVTWNMGDGNSITCNGPGTQYDTTKPDGVQHSDCTYSYSASSANQPNHAYTVTATVQWRTTWQASDGTNGQLNTLIRTTTATVPVREIQAINVAPAGGW